MVADIALDVAELQALRQEITSHFTLSTTLMPLELAAFGSSLSLVDKSTYILPTLAVISSFLWLPWIDHSTQILKIAAYIAVELAPRMSQYLGRPVLDWEIFLRRIDSGGETSAKVLYGISSPPRTAVVRPLRPEWYTPLLFGIAPPLLLILYAAANLHGGTTTMVVWSACVIGAAFWAFTISRFIDFVRNSKIIDRAILASSSSARHHEGDAKAAVHEQTSTYGIASSVRSSDAQIDSTDEPTCHE
jgi:hypothetical protein